MGFFRTMLSVAGFAAVGAPAAPAIAHHSYVMFDNDKTTTLQGAVKALEWTNPHTSIQLIVKDPATGKDVEWSIEGGSPNGLARRGWSRTSLKPGDMAVITVHPLKDGAAGGQLITAMVDGKPIGSVER